MTRSGYSHALTTTPRGAILSAAGSARIWIEAHMHPSQEQTKAERSLHPSPGSVGQWASTRISGSAAYRLGETCLSCPDRPRDADCNYASATLRICVRPTPILYPCPASDRARFTWTVWSAVW